MEKIVTDKGMASYNISFRGNRAIHIAPLVADVITDEEGVMQYVLENGNLFPAEKYDVLWNPPKGIIITDKKYKGDNPDKTRII